MKYMLEKAVQMKGQIKMLSENVDDATAIKCIDVYEKYVVGKNYKTGERFVYDEKMYKVLQNHISQADWMPNATHSLYTEVLMPDDTKVYDWKQPGSTSLYNKGDKVKHKEKVWESLIDNNVWEPGAVGTESLWKEISKEDAEAVIQGTKTPEQVIGQ